MNSGADNTKFEVTSDSLLLFQTVTAVSSYLAVINFASHCSEQLPGSDQLCESLQ